MPMPAYLTNIMKYYPISLVIFVTCFLVPFTGRTQVYGCNDPLANNYNPAVTNNDGSCTYNLTSYTPPVKVNPWSDTLVETSGLQMMGNYLWSFNDNGGSASIYRIDTLTKAVLQTVHLGGAQNVDWEDIAFDGTYVYIGDIGNNSMGARADLKIYKFLFSAIPDQLHYPSASIPSPVIEIINFSYSDQPLPLQPVSPNTAKFDCEAMVVDGGKIHLFTKNWVDNNTTHYVINGVTAGTYSASPLETLATNYLVTAADKMPGQDVIALLGYQNSGTAKHFLHLLSGYSGGKYFNGNKRRIDLPDVLYMGQSEGICFRNGLYGYISNERFQRTVFGTTIVVNPQLHSFTVQGLLQNMAVIYQFEGNGNWDEPTNWAGNNVPSLVLTGGSEIIIDPIAGGQCKLNIPYTLSAGCTLTIKSGKSFLIQEDLRVQQ